MSHTHTSPATPGRVLEVAGQLIHDLRAVTTPEGALNRVARAIVEAGLYRRAVLTLCNAQGDVIAAGQSGIPDGAVAPGKVRQASSEPAHKISDSHFVSATARTGRRKGRRGESPGLPDSEGDWQPDDKLLVPIRDADGTAVGQASVDGPFDGRRPDLVIVHRLELLVHLAEQALTRLGVRASPDAAESQFESLVAGAEDITMRANPLQNRIEFVNPAAEKLTGYSTDYLLSQPLDVLIRLIVYPDDQKKLLEVWGGRRAEPGSVGFDPLEMEFRLRHASGAVRWVRQKSFVVRDNDGRIAAVEAVLCDNTDRRSIAERLAESERASRLLAEHMRDLAYLRDMEGNFRWVSPSVTRYLGAAPEEVVGTHFSDWLTERAVNRAAFEVHNIKVGGGAPVRPIALEMRSRTGQTCHLELTESLLRDDRGAVVGIQGVGRDITSAMSTREALENSEQRFRELADLLPQAVYEIDLEGRLTFANQCARTVFGYSEKEFGLGQDVLQLFVPEDRIRLQENMQARLSGQEPTRHGYTGVRKDGGTFPATIYSSTICRGGQTVGFRGVIIDLTDQRRAEQALRESEARLRSIAENMPVMMDAFDETGSIVAWNKECERVTGYSAAEMIGNPRARELLYPDQEYRARMQEEWAKRGGDYYDWEWGMTCKDGSVKTIAWSNISRRFPVPGWATWGIGVDVTWRKHAEATLRHSERTFKALFDAISDSVVLIDMDARVQAANRAFCERFGIPVADLIGKDIRDYLPSEVVISRAKHGETALATKQPVTAEDKRGEYVFLSTYYPVLDEGGTPTGLVVVGRDITQQKQAEDKLRESEKQYQELFNSILEGIGIVDEAERITFCNPALARIYEEESPETLIGHSALDYVSGSAREQILLQTERRRRGESSRYELDITTAKENHRTILASTSPRVDGNGRYVGAFGAVLDITERKKAEEALRRSEETAQALLNATTESAMLMDPGGKILAINETAARGLGAAVDHPPGSMLFDILPPTAAPSTKALMEQVARTGQPVPFQGEFGGRFFEGNIHPLFDTHGHVERMALFARDVTEREAILRQLWRKSQEVDRANDVLQEMVSELHRKNRRYRKLMKQFEEKNAELEIMVFMLPHDLKAPLISIREQAARFRLRYGRLLDEGGQALARRISANAGNMLRLVESLLDYARAKDYVGRVDEVKLDRLVEEIWERVTDTFADRVVKLRRPPEGLSCRVSRPALERVLWNLLHNAVAYVPSDCLPEVDVQWSKTDDRLTLVVADNGRGIPDEERERIFNLFYRVQPAVGEGSGVGLAVVKRIVDSAGGAIVVAPRAEGGTVFTIELPLAASTLSSA